MELGRRSSRTVRTSAPIQSASQPSSNSSNSSGRAERATRSHHKIESPRKPNRSTSSSSEPTDMTPVEDTMQTRGKRGRAGEREKATKSQAVQVEATNGTDEIVEDDEAVRCICGFDEYPGPPQLEEDSKNGIKEGIEDHIISAADVTEDLAGFFLQCDVCKVWQHGGCVGIMNEDSSPEEYFCEDCRKDLHRIFVAPNGQRYSHYLPLYQSLSATTSRAASFSKDGTKSPKGSRSGRPPSSLQSGKRRSTMNSRDAAYDEEEQLRRAIEASNQALKGTESLDGSAPRRGKRGRSDSMEKPEVAKRQKTASRSPSAEPEVVRLASQVESDDGAATRAVGAKKIRGAAARNHKEKELREEKERQRLEAKQKRMGRAERRRVEDSDALEETPAPTKAPHSKAFDNAVQPPEPPFTSEVATPDSPPTNLAPIPHRKGGRPPNIHKKKLGKNQYTKDRDPLDRDNQSPNRSQSREVQKDDHGNVSNVKGSNHEAKHSKSKNIGVKHSMFDMKKRVAAILEFITRTQLEMAGDAMSAATRQAAETLIGGLADGLPMIRVNGDNSDGSATTSEATSPVKEFKDLSLMDQMDVLTRQLVKWQKEFT